MQSSSLVSVITISFISAGLISLSGGLGLISARLTGEGPIVKDKASFMASGRKTGGRTKGTPNKRTQEVVQRLRSLGCDPIEGMALIAMDDANSMELRARVYMELAQYVAPKRKALALSSTADERVVFNIGLPDRRKALLK